MPLDSINPGDRTQQSITPANPQKPLSALNEEAERIGNVQHNALKKNDSKTQSDVTAVSRDKISSSFSKNEPPEVSNFVSSVSQHIKEKSSKPKANADSASFKMTKVLENRATIRNNLQKAKNQLGAINNQIIQGQKLELDEEYITNPKILEGLIKELNVSLKNNLETEFTFLNTYQTNFKALINKIEGNISNLEIKIQETEKEIKSLSDGESEKLSELLHSQLKDQESITNLTELSDRFKNVLLPKIEQKMAQLNKDQSRLSTSSELDEIISSFNVENSEDLPVSLDELIARLNGVVDESAFNDDLSSLSNKDFDDLLDKLDKFK